MRSVVFVFVVVALLVVSGCDLVDPARPSAQPDTEVFGNLAEVSRSPDNPGQWILQIQVGSPRALRSAEEESGKPTPEVAKGLVATVTVTADTIVVADDLPVSLDAIDSGTEVVIVPVPGTTQMWGSSDLRLEADTLVDFKTYRRWKLPRLESDDEPVVDDPDRINTSGSELAPVPVQGGRVLYFSSHLRPPAAAGEEWYGTVREGLTVPEEGEALPEWSYRTEMGDAGWSVPERVVFPGLDGAVLTRVTWVNADETRCLVTVGTPGEPPWVGLATRSGAASGWGEPEVVEEIGPNARDAVYLTGSTSKVLFASNRGGRERDDLFLFDPKAEEGAMPLQPQICTFGNEWNPRTGAKGELFFCRENQQLAFVGGSVRPLRLPGEHRTLFTQAASTEDGKWLFFCMPKFRPVMMDDDIYVAPLGEDLALGEPVPVDDWRP